ncbi:DNA ligase [Paenibacillus sp. OAS669]|uniref:ATP-dependent DNA ligase n=1 Tax=Paenibacillus sp. OAS669 TaxID=2663821 RepID=UPI0019DD5786|nr:DNA ligase [Paenibacillus sp. OAS669]MBE1442188.1 bifunctional non-homologous end joining protein LigD [Paenibacillus sp. OAS669]
MQVFTPYQPMNVSIQHEPFDDPQYLFEPKWDGWRIVIHKQGSRIEAYTRHGNKVTKKFPELEQAVSAIQTHTAILDCEGIVMRDGRPVFDDFSYRGRLSSSMRIAQAVATHPVTFVAFDLLFTEREHSNEPLMERKGRLHELLVPNSVIMPTLYVMERGKALFELTRERDMEGIVAKRTDSIYRPGTLSRDWVKIKHFKTIDAVILGFRTNPFALVIGLQFRTVKNKPVGVVEFGLTYEDKECFMELSKDLYLEHDKQTQWIQPKLCCRIQYLERTDTHQLRTTIFKQFLPDKNPEDCIWHS